MTRDDAITALVNGLTAMERGKENPFPIPSMALDAYQTDTRCISSYAGISLSAYRVFVCAVILGYYDDVIEGW